MRLSNRAVNQIMAAMFQNHPLDSKLIPQHSSPKWTSRSVTKVLKSIPTFFFQSPKSIARQNTFRQESIILGPAAYTDPHKLNLGLNKAMEFFFWVENNFEFTHDEITCREMSCLLAEGSDVNTLLGFLDEISRREISGLVTVKTITCLIKVLAKIGLADEALATFYRMEMFHCQPDVYAYNTIIYELCQFGNFKKAKILFEQMELPGCRCPPDTFTYTILINAYCKHALQTGCKNEIRRRLWEADNLFRIMLFKGFNPDEVIYNCLIDSCCKSYWIERALELLDDMVKRGCCPDHVTCDSIVKYYCVTNEIDKALEVVKGMSCVDIEMPNISSYNPIIHALCEAGRVMEAEHILVELIHAGHLPGEYAYKLVRDMLKLIGEIGFLDDDLGGEYDDDIKYLKGYFKRDIDAPHPGKKHYFRSSENASYIISEFQKKQSYKN